jgi:hypothetical protein
MVKRYVYSLRTTGALFRLLNNRIVISSEGGSASFNIGDTITVVTDNAIIEGTISGYGRKSTEDDILNWLILNNDNNIETSRIYVLFYN